MAVLMATASGEQHGLINTLTNNVPFDDFKSYSPEMKEKMKKEKKEDSRIVEAEYHNFKGRHERWEGPYCKYAGDPIQIWKFIPGHVYKVPMGLVKQINGMEDKQVKRAGLMEVDGKSVNRDGSPLDRDQKGERVHLMSPVSFN